ncbi:hypothetical protein C5F64_16350 [Photobacterium damselae subsp. damselae]|uniref:hypothetical protein n=1 Tax=Photobacterium damselae TaxID=38293 RepID=UPI000D074E99|nr:hypothetical protein [Photobacterium damselae]PSB82344.1 hypothetical protein C5F64_16350 [Photobacterium damselae subsp. damselae]
MYINLIMYICGSIFAVLGIVVAIWSFIDTYRIRSAVEFHQEREDRIQAARSRYEEKTRKGND